MNEENLYSDKAQDNSNEEKPSRYDSMPDKNADGIPSGNPSVPYGSHEINEQISQEPKPEVSWNEPQREIYREGTYQSRGEYHQTPLQGMNQQNSYQQNPYQQMQQEPYQAESQGFGIASLVMGIISLVLCCSCINVPIAVAAIVFGILQLVKSNSRKGAAIAGIVTSALSIVIFFISLIAMLVSTDFRQGFENGFENGLEDFYYNYDIPNYGNGHHNDHDDTF